MNGYTGCDRDRHDKRCNRMQKEELTDAIALRRLGKPEDVAAAVCFLASDNASYLTGMFMEISGGKFCVQNPDLWKWNEKTPARLP